MLSLCKRIFAIICFIAVFIDLKAERQLYTGESSSDFVIRWQYQSFCDFVYDARYEYSWSSAPHLLTFDPSLVKPADVVFVRNARRFYKEVHPFIKNPYIIVSAGDMHEMMDNAPRELLNDPLVIAWFGIHPNSFVMSHKKFHALPIGILQHREYYNKKTELNSYLASLRNSEKKYLAYYNLCIDSLRPERLEVQSLLEKKPFVKVGKNLPWKEYLAEMAQCKFAFSPFWLCS